MSFTLFRSRMLVVWRTWNGMDGLLVLLLVVNLLECLAGLYLFDGLEC
jgi:hypothetical protein